MKRPPKLVRRLSDNAVFEPSCPDGYTAADAFADAMESAAGRPSYYFRRVEPAPLRWFDFGERWRRTGEIWEPADAREFEVIGAGVA